MINLGKISAGHAKLLAGIERTVKDELGRAADFADQHVQKSRAFKDRTGRLRRSGRHKVRRNKLTLGWSAPYAGYVEYGTRPHVIKPRRASALRFVAGGRTVFAKKVNHPGTKPRKFGYRATRAAYRVLGQRLSVRLGKLGKSF